MISEGDIWELFGIFESMVCFVHNPPRETQEMESELPALAALRAPLAKTLAKKFQELLRRLSRKRDRKLSIPTLEQLTMRRERLSQGTSAFVTADGEFPGMKTISARIYYLLWFLWPEIEHQFTAPFIHGWLVREHGLHASDKLVERIVTELRKAGKTAQDTAGQP